MKKIATALLSVWLLATAATLQSCDNDDDDYYRDERYESLDDYIDKL